MATGMNNEDSDKRYEEKIVLTKEDGNMKLSVGGFISSKNVEYISEDEYMRITVKKKITYYDKIIYEVSIKNKTNYAILLSRKNEKKSVGISLDGESSEEVVENYNTNERCIYGGNEYTMNLTFNKYFDEDVNKTSITFNKIRILQEYTGVEENWEDEINNKLVKQYSATISVK